MLGIIIPYEWVSYSPARYIYFFFHPIEVYSSTSDKTPKAVCMHALNHARWSRVSRTFYRISPFRLLLHIKVHACAHNDALYYMRVCRENHKLNRAKCTTFPGSWSSLLIQFVSRSWLLVNNTIIHPHPGRSNVRSVILLSSMISFEITVLSLNGKIFAGTMKLINKMALWI